MVRWIGAVVFALYLLSIPWYREPGAVPRVVLGLPDWVVVAVGCYAMAALLTAIAWLIAPFDDEDGAE